MTAMPTMLVVAATTNSEEKQEYHPTSPLGE